MIFFPNFDIKLAFSIINDKYIIIMMLVMLNICTNNLKNI